MDDRRTAWMFYGVIALTIVNLLGWGRYNYQITRQGHMSEEFVVNWVATRALIIDKESPYQEDVTRTILTVLGTGSAPTIGRVPQFISPIYTIFVILPFALIADLSVAQTLWVTVQQTLLVVLILISVRLSPVRPERLVFGLLVFTTFLGYHALEPISKGSTIILSALFLFLSVLSIHNDRDELGGIFLCLTTIQLPHLILPVCLILLWSLTQNKRLVALWFFCTLVLLTVLGIFVLRNWLLQYLAILLRYPLYLPTSSPGAAFHTWWPGISTLLSWVLTGTTLIVMLIEWWGALRGKYYLLVWTIGFTLVISMWIGLPVLPQNLILLLLPLTLCVSAWSRRWGSGGNVLAIISMLLVYVWEWWLVIENLSSTQQVDTLKLLIPLPLICLIGLFWIRSSFVHPKRLLIDDLRARENE